MPNQRTKEPFRCRGRRTKNDRVFGERRVYRARMAASNKLRVTPSHSLQPTTGLHQWYVHIPTYGRAVASKPAGFGSYERPRPPWCMRESSALRPSKRDSSVHAGVGWSHGCGLLVEPK